MNNFKELIFKNKKYIYIGILILIIIFIGFIYGNKTTKKYEEKQSIINIEEKQEKKEINLIKVDIKGEIKNPGVYELNENERIIDVIDKAGGLTDEANTNNLNLSKKVHDEMVIIIYSNDEIEEYEKSLLNEPEIIEKEVIKYEVVEKEIPCPNTTNNACINETKIEDKKIEELNNKINVLNKEQNKVEEINDINNKTNNLININEATKEELLSLPGIGELKADLIIDYRNNESFKDIEDIKNVKGIGESLFEKIKDYITI